MLCVSTKKRQFHHATVARETNFKFAALCFVFFTLFFSPSLGVLFADSSIAFPLPAQKNSRRLQAVKDEISPHSLSSPPKTLLLAQVE